LERPVSNAEVKVLHLSLTLLRLELSEDDSDVTGEASDKGDEYSQFYSGGDDMVQQSEGTLDARAHLNVSSRFQTTTMTPTTNSYRLEAQVTDSRVAPLTAGELRCLLAGPSVANADPDRYVYHKGEVAKVGVEHGDTRQTGRRKSATQFVERTWTKKEKKEDTNTKRKDIHTPNMRCMSD